MVYGLLNLGSIIFGLAGLAIPLIVLLKKTEPAKGYMFLMGSLVFCMAAVFLQLCYGNHLVEIEDWTALMDTSGAAVGLSGKLIVCTIILVVAAFWRTGRREK